MKAKQKPNDKKIKKILSLFSCDGCHVPWRGKVFTFIELRYLSCFRLSNECAERQIANRNASDENTV